MIRQLTISILVLLGLLILGEQTWVPGRLHHLSTAAQKAGK